MVRCAKSVKVGLRVFLPIAQGRAGIALRLGLLAKTSFWAIGLLCNFLFSSILTPRADAARVDSVVG